MRFERFQSPDAFIAQDVRCLAGKMKTGGIGTAAVLLCDPDNGQHEPEHEIKAELPLVAWYEAEDDRFRFTFGATPDYDAFFYQRLFYDLFNLTQCLSQGCKRYDDLGWY